MEKTPLLAQALGLDQYKHQKNLELFVSTNNVKIQISEASKLNKTITDLTYAKTMTTISFHLLDKYLNKQSQINGKINSLRGDFNATQTEDGTAYMVDFKKDSSASIFEQWLEDLIPDINDY